MEKILRVIVEYRKDRLVASSRFEVRRGRQRLVIWYEEEKKMPGERSTKSNIELEPRVREAVLKAATEGSITCPAARELADRLGVDPSIIGEACNQLRIKLKGCALGCFR